jgi:tRNA-splicing ligase RtcB
VKPRELHNLGVPKGEPLRQAVRACAQAAERSRDRDALRASITALLADPERFAADEVYGGLATAVLASRRAGQGAGYFEPRNPPAPWRSWGEGLEGESVRQMEAACALPVAVRGALMPDAHVGYGLPIGGVLAADNAVIPYAVGVDIACRMRLSVLDLPPAALDDQRSVERLTRAIESQTRFGMGAEFQRPREHAVLDDDWSITPVTARIKDKARAQLGTSGTGNHFVEFGVLTIAPEHPPLALGLPEGCYVALLSHSGSRGSGAAVCDHYSRLAERMNPHLPPEFARLAWLPLDTSEGRDYWNAMELMGRYAAANHECIHRAVAAETGACVLAAVENHHNFAWMESHDLNDGRGPREVVVHRKGATPAALGVLGIIPGSMASPGFVVRGRGDLDSLRSASHGAGRAMSRTKARESFAWGNVRRDIERLNVRVLSAGIDEVPGAYKDIHAVMALQTDLVEVVARFDPRLVKMAPDGERAED